MAVVFSGSFACAADKKQAICWGMAAGWHRSGDLARRRQPPAGISIHVEHRPLAAAEQKGAWSRKCHVRMVADHGWRRADGGSDAGVEVSQSWPGLEPELELPGRVPPARASTSQQRPSLRRAWLWLVRLVVVLVCFGVVPAKKSSPITITTTGRCCDALGDKKNLGLNATKSSSTSRETRHHTPDQHSPPPLTRW